MASKDLIVTSGFGAGHVHVFLKVSIVMVSSWDVVDRSEPGFFARAVPYGE
jgi:hypothetical protein